MFEGFNERLDSWMKENNIKQVDIYKKGQGLFTQAYVSMVKKGVREPNQEFLSVISKMSGKMLNWWVHGKDEYENWNSLKEIVNMFFDNGMIDKDGNMSSTAKEVVFTMVEKEIRVLAKARKNKEVE